MTVRRRATCRTHLLLALVLVGACSPSPGSTTAVDRTPLVASLEPSASMTAGGASPVATLPGGLELRPQLPPLRGGEVAACVPVCRLGRVAGGAMPNGHYQTRWFFGGYMTLVTDDTWSLREDSNGELAIFLPDDTEYAIAFWLDPEPYRHGQRVSGVGQDARAFLVWLASNPNLVVSAEKPGSIGPVPATSVDVKLSATAGQDETDCGADPCISFINNRAFDHVGGIIGDDVYRFYFADVSYSGSDHLLIAMVEGRDQKHLDSLTPTIDGLLSTVTVPARPG